MCIRYKISLNIHNVHFDLYFEFKMHGCDWSFISSTGGHGGRGPYRLRTPQPLQCRERRARCNQVSIVHQYRIYFSH